jgi:phage gp36-like protein
VKHSLAAALPAMTELQGELRREEYRSALTYLENVAACKIEIEAPDDAELAEAGATTGRARYGGDPLMEIPLF